MMVNSFPYELLENIAFNLSTQDQYTCLTICKSWYMPFCRALYRHIKFTHREQLKQCLSSLSQHGRLIRTIQIGVSAQQFKPEDCVTGAIPLLPIQVGVTLYELVQLIQHLPLLQSLLFDHRLWHFMDTSSIHFINCVKSLPPLDHPRQLRLLDGQMMNKLHLRGADMFQLHQQNNFLNIFKGMQTLVDLTIDGDGMWDTEHVMKFTMEDMDTLHTYLPSLQKLNITDAVHFIIREERKQERGISQLKEFQLFALVDQHAVTVWFNYFGSKYPLLTSLNIKLMPTTVLVNSNNDDNKQQLASFSQFLNKLTNLKSIKIHSSMSKLFMNDTTLVKKQHLTNLELGLWGQDIETCTKALEMINPTAHALTHLVIPIWSSSMDLSVLTQLTHLDLFCKTKRRPSSLSSVEENKPAIVEEGESKQEVYAIDTILDHCPILTHLELNWGQTSSVSSLKYQEHKHLKTIRLIHVSISDSNIFAYLSIRCPKLEGLFLRRCTGVIELNMLNTHFKYIVISELLQQQQSTIDYLKLIQFQRLEKHKKRRANNSQMARWYKSYQHAYTFQTCIQRLKQEIVEEPFISVLCGSVQQLVFNGCRI